jgi:hypothetical protein
MRGGFATKLSALRRAGVWLALAAMILRAALPAGWMPGTASGIPLVICTAAGAVTLPFDIDGRPLSPQSTHDTAPCVFAAAPPLATPATTPAILPPSWHTAYAALPEPVQSSGRLDLRVAQPRAPPTFS